MIMSKRTIRAIFDEMTDKQKTEVYAIVGLAIEDVKKGEKIMTTKEKLRAYIENDIKDTIGFYDAYKQYCYFPQVSKVIYHDPATIVYWNDGTKTVVKCAKGDVYNPVTGLAVCFVKKFLGPLYLQEFKKNLPKTIESNINNENKNGIRANIFADQCPTCEWYYCRKSCAKCGANSMDDVRFKTCGCCNYSEPDETSCKYYKEAE